MDNNYCRYLYSLQNEPLMFEQMLIIVKIFHIENTGFFAHSHTKYPYLHMPQIELIIIMVKLIEMPMKFNIE